MEEALEKSPLTENQKKQLQLTFEVRDFMAKNLGLNVNKNFKSYVHLNRDYVTYVVSASPKDQLEHYKWKFPIIGSVPYKGYFVLDQAKKEKQLMDDKGFDTYLRGVSAYSTLGWFSDPLLSSMLQYDQDQLVDTLIHETVHANLYIKGASQFNERVASFLAEVGTREFYRTKPSGQKILEELAAKKRDRHIFSTFITAEVSHLRNWYKNQSKDSDTIKIREQKFQDIKKRFSKEIIPRLETDSYNYFKDIDINNARLLLYDLYVGDQTLFNKLVEVEGDNFQKLLKFLKKLEGTKKPEEALKKMLQ